MYVVIKWFSWRWWCVVIVNVDDDDDDSDGGKSDCVRFIVIILFYINKMFNW